MTHARQPDNSPSFDELLNQGADAFANIIVQWQAAVFNVTVEEYLRATNLTGQAATNCIIAPKAIDYALAREKELVLTSPDCDAACAQRQRQALLDLYRNNNGPNWQVPVYLYGQSEERARRMHEMSNGTSVVWPWPVDEEPAHPWVHCSWAGVLCCSADHTLYYPVMDPTGEFILGWSNSAFDNDVRCIQPGGILAVGLPLSNLTGSLPDSFFDALGSSLEYLDLHTNSQKGQIDDRFRKLRLLKAISLSDNQFSGEIGEIWKSLPFVRFLALTSNRFTGPAPSTLVSMPLLRSLAVADNKLSGDIPDTYMWWISLESVTFDNNALSGVFPQLDSWSYFYTMNVAQFGSSGRPGCRTYSVISIRNNKVEGRIPSIIATLALETLDFGQNRFSGPIPPELGLNPFLRELYLDSNLFEGEIPAQLGVFGMQTIDLRNNLLVGTIPENIGVQTLKILKLSGNVNLTGQIPPSFSRLQQIEYFEAMNTGLTYGSRPNSRGERLPEFLTFDYAETEVVLSTPTAPSLLTGKAAVAADPVRLTIRCHPIVGVASSGWAATTVRVDPYFYDYQHCSCPPSYRAVWKMDTVLNRRYMFCEEVTDPLTTSELLTAILVPAVAGGLIVVAGLFTVLRYKSALIRAHIEWQKRRGPPGMGRPVTLVLTDVEGSTLLWESFPQVMSEALDLHDRVMRKMMAKFFGYEVATEGDSFLIAFHTAEDATGFCLAVQQILLALPWPHELLQHPKAQIITDATLYARPDSDPSLVSGTQDPAKFKTQAREVASSDRDQAQDHMAAYEVEHDYIDTRYQRWWRPHGTARGIPRGSNGAFNLRSSLSRWFPSFRLSSSSSSSSLTGLTRASAATVPPDARQYAAPATAISSGLPPPVPASPGQPSSPRRESDVDVTVFEAEASRVPATLISPMSSPMPANESELEPQTPPRTISPPPPAYFHSLSASSSPVLKSVQQAETQTQTDPTCTSLAESNGLGAAEQAATAAPRPHRSNKSFGLKAIDEEDASGDTGPQVWECDEPVLFRGLRVRMGVASGEPDRVAKNTVTQRREYFGPVVTRVGHASDAGHGGQILVDAETFTELHGKMEQIAHTVAHEVLGVAPDVLAAGFPLYSFYGGGRESGECKPGSSAPSTSTKGKRRSGASTGSGAAVDLPEPGPRSGATSPPHDPTKPREKRPSLSRLSELMPWASHSGRAETPQTPTAVAHPRALHDGEARSKKTAAAPTTMTSADEELDLVRRMASSPARVGGISQVQRLSLYNNTAHVRAPIENDLSLFSRTSSTTTVMDGGGPGPGSAGTGAERAVGFTPVRTGPAATHLGKSLSSVSGSTESSHVPAGPESYWSSRTVGGNGQGTSPSKRSNWWSSIVGQATEAQAHGAAHGHKRPGFLSRLASSLSSCRCAPSQPIKCSAAVAAVSSGHGKKHHGNSSSGTFFTTSSHGQTCCESTRLNTSRGGFDHDLTRIITLDQGEYAVETSPGTVIRLHLFEICPIGLEERSRLYPPITSGRKISPAYFDAPGTTMATLRQVCKHGLDPHVCKLCSARSGPLPKLTVIFCAPSGLSEIRAYDKGAADQAQALWRQAIRKAMRTYGGYENQESNGSFMISFECPAAAVRWALRTQMDLMLQPWPKSLLQYEASKEVWGLVDSTDSVTEAPGPGGSSHGATPSTFAVHTQKVVSPPLTAVLEQNTRGRTSFSFTQPPAGPGTTVSGPPLTPVTPMPSSLSMGVPTAPRLNAKVITSGIDIFNEEEGELGETQDTATTATGSGSKKKVLLFRGLRAVMGIHEGVPARIRPHLSSGRADVFGPVVNRAARFSYAVARPGQVLAEMRMLLECIRVMVEHVEAKVTFIRDPAWLEHLDNGFDPITLTVKPQPAVPNEEPPSPSLVNAPPAAVTSGLSSASLNLGPSAGFAGSVSSPLGGFLRIPPPLVIPPVPDNMSREQSSCGEPMCGGSDVETTSVTLEFRDVGLYSLKGVLGQWRLGSVNCNFIRRTFPGSVSSRKGTMVEPGTGLFATVVLPPETSALMERVTMLCRKGVENVVDASDLAAEILRSTSKAPRGGAQL